MDEPKLNLTNCFCIWILSNTRKQRSGIRRLMPRPKGWTRSFKMNFISRIQKKTLLLPGRNPNRPRRIHESLQYRKNQPREVLSKKIAYANIPRQKEIVSKIRLWKFCGKKWSSLVSYKHPKQETNYKYKSLLSQLITAQKIPWFDWKAVLNQDPRLKP